MKVRPSVRRWGVLGLAALACLATPAGAQHASAPPARPGIYVDLESWIYPAFDRLIARGLVQSGLVGMRPWTRAECARLLDEALELHSGFEGDPEMNTVIHRLARELASELQDVRNGPFSLGAEEMYVRVLGASQSPLEDGYYFGQTLVNDRGRPLRKGANFVSGFAAQGGWRSLGMRLAVEHRHSQDGEPMPLAARQAIADVDRIPLPPGAAPRRRNELRLLDSYVSLTWSHWTLSAGRHSLRWGHGQTGSMSFSESAEPVLMVRLNRSSPGKIPLLGFLGPVRSEIFLGRLEGHEHVFFDGQLHVAPLERQPWIHGGRIAFKPTPNLELGFSSTTLFSGPGAPFNARTLWRSVSLGNTETFNPNDPGDRRSAFDFQYRLPLLRDWVTVYNDSMTEDEFSPIAYPRRSAMAPGVYLSRIPGLPKMDFRMEGFYTDLPRDPRRGVFFANTRFVDGFRNRQVLMGHPVGRQGHGFALQSTYWTDPVRFYRVFARHFETSEAFLPGGNTRTVAGFQLREVFALGGSGSEAHITALVQYERLRIPILQSAVGQNPLTIGVRVSILPNSRLGREAPSRGKR